MMNCLSSYGRLNLEVDLLSQLLGLVVLGAGVAVGCRREQSGAHGAAAAFTAEVLGPAREPVGQTELFLPQFPVSLPNADTGQHNSPVRRGKTIKSSNTATVINAFTCRESESINTVMTCCSSCIHLSCV